MPSNAERIQLVLRIDAEIAARLDNLCATYRKRSRTHVAEEILMQCLDVYEQSEIAKFKVLACRPDAET